MKNSLCVHGNAIANDCNWSLLSVQLKFFIFCKPALFVLPEAIRFGLCGPNPCLDFPESFVDHMTRFQPVDFEVIPPSCFHGYNMNKAQENCQPQDGRVQISRSTHGRKPSSIRNPSLNSYINKKYIFIMLSHYNFRFYCSNQSLQYSYLS